MFEWVCECACVCLYICTYVCMINAKTRSIKAQAHTHAPTHTYADFFLECVRFVRSFIVRFVLFRFVSRVFLVVVSVVVLLYGNKWAELPTAFPPPPPPAFPAPRHVLSTGFVTSSSCAWPYARFTHIFCFIRFWGRVSLNLKSREQSKGRKITAHWKQLNLCA